MKYALLLSFLLLLISCDCWQKVGGTVVDKTTGKPIDSVSILTFGHQSGNYTDSTGHFEFTVSTGGGLKCPMAKLSFQKAGYKTTTQTLDGNNSQNATITLEKN